MEELEKVEEGLVTLTLTPEEALRLKNLLARKGGSKGPKIYREGNRIIIDTGLDEFCTFNKGTPTEVHAFRIYTRAERHKVNEAGEVIPESVIPALTVIEKVEGGFCYMDSREVNKREDLEIIAKQHLQKAFDWFDSCHSAAGEAKKRVRA